MKNKLIYFVVFQLFCLNIWSQNYVNVKDLGATGNGTTNDFAAINRALNNSSVKSVYFPEGNYYIGNNTLQITHNNMHIWGDGISKTQIKTAKGYSIMSIDADNVSVDNIRFQSTAYGMPEDSVLKSANSGIAVQRYRKDIAIKNCLFDGLTMGIIFISENKRAIITECVFQNMKFLVYEKQGSQIIDGAGGYGILFQHVASQNRIGTDDYVVEKCFFDRTVYRHCIYTQSSSGKIINNVFLGDHTKYCTTYEARLMINGTGKHGVLVHGNTFDGGLYAIDTHDGTNSRPINQNLIITDNVFENFTQLKYNNGIVKICKADGVNVSGNIIKDIKGIGIQVGDNTKNLIISDNQILDISPFWAEGKERPAYGIAFLDQSGKNTAYIYIHDNLIQVKRGTGEISKNSTCIAIDAVPVSGYQFGRIYIRNNIFRDGMFGFKASTGNLILSNMVIDNNIGINMLLDNLVKIYSIEGANIRKTNNYIN